MTTEVLAAAAEFTCNNLRSVDGLQYVNMLVSSPDVPAGTIEVSDGIGTVYSVIQNVRKAIIGNGS
jgi:hypothetical protein